MAIDPKDLAALEEVQEIVDTHLRALKFFPAGTGGSIAVARLLVETVESTDQALQLCRHIIQEYDEWPGPATLAQEYIRVCKPQTIYTNPPRLVPEPIDCQACADRGVIRGTDNRWRACECWPEIPPRLLTALNRPPTPRRTPKGHRRRGWPLIPESQAEMEEVLARAAKDSLARIASPNEEHAPEGGQS